MLDHYIQRDIVYQLAFTEGDRFSDLKPEGIENKLFNYHLKKLIVAGYVEKSSEGLYRLSPEGRRVGVGAFRDHHMSIDRAYSILIMAVRRSSDGAWLLYRRHTHPLRGLSGFMHTTPIALKDSVTRAKEECYEKTGLTGDFSVVGNGYFRVFENDELESFTHFTLLKCDDATGELIQNNDLAEYFWETDPDFSTEGVLPNMQTLHQLYLGEIGPFVEKTFYLVSDAS